VVAKGVANSVSDDTIYYKRVLTSDLRTMSVIALLDCAMRIYTNHPCRLILVELDSDLPCKESIFNSDHPFMEDGNIFAPRLTISKAFALLFQGNAKRSLSIVKKSSEEPDAEDDSSSTTLGDLTKFDLFILIHCECPRSPLTTLAPNLTRTSSLLY
jgi:hypothetical protein